MKLLMTTVFFGLYLGLNAQIDIKLLYGNWCVVEVLNAADAEEEIPQDELNEMRLDMSEVIFCFTSDQKFTVIEPGMTLNEALEEALVFVYDKTSQTLEMEDTFTGEMILIELVKVTKSELVFRSYNSVFGFEMYFKRC